mmetsp:Transcript_42004/g.120104  ORF Transcript_42004/g.120104 Transcript_42004/m.120104 type:complete len:132 (-) Transcript_42004:77-472(-)
MGLGRAGTARDGPPARSQVQRTRGSNEGAAAAAAAAAAALEPIFEDEPLHGYGSDSDNEACGEAAKRDVTPMFLPGIQDHVTMEEAINRAKRRGGNAFAFGAFAFAASSSSSGGSTPALEQQAKKLEAKRS